MLSTSKEMFKRDSLSVLYWMSIWQRRWALERSIFSVDILSSGLPLKSQTLALGTFTQTAAYVIQGPAPPFPLFVAAYAFSGFGMSLQVRIDDAILCSPNVYSCSIQSAQSMVYISSLKTHAAMKMGISQACYGKNSYQNGCHGHSFVCFRFGSFSIASCSNALCGTTTLVISVTWYS